MTTFTPFHLWLNKVSLLVSGGEAPVSSNYPFIVFNIFQTHPFSFPSLLSLSVSTTVPSFVTDQVATLSESIGFEQETLSYALGLFLCYPLGIIMAMLPYGAIRHAFSFLLGAFLLQFTIGKQWIHHMVTVVISYLMLLILPRRISKSVIPWFLMTYLTLGHLHRQYINYLGYDLDFTGSHMVLVMKLYSLGYNLYDGEQLAHGNKAAKKYEDVAITELPSFIEFLGYTFNFSSILAGPAFEFKIYKDACDGTHLYDANGKPKGKIPSRVLPTMKPFITSLICLGLFVVGTSIIPLLDVNDPQRSLPPIVTGDFMKNHWVYRFSYSCLAVFFTRQKYYFAWKNAEGACNIYYVGFQGFNDKDGTVKGWDHSCNMDIIEHETAPNVGTSTASWNKKTANWLKRYVYMRTGGSLVATYGMSAFWHGFYPGYYMFFLSVPLMQTCARLGRKKISPHFASTSKSKWSTYRIICTLVTFFMTQYMVVPQLILSYEWSMQNWKNNYFFGHILCIIFYIIVSKLPTPPKNLTVAPKEKEA